MNARLEYQDEDGIRALLLDRIVVKVDDETLQLDDGAVLKIVANEGCGGCANGWYDLKELNDCPVNAIMAVEFETDNDKYDDPEKLRVFVLAQDERIKLLEVEGDVGNGYYGAGYWIEVTRP